MQFVCAPIVGNLSDQFGRRPVLLASLVGFGVDYLFMALAPTLSCYFSAALWLAWWAPTASAYIADVSTPEKRAQNFGLIGAAFGLGFIIRPLIGGLVGVYGTRIPFLVAAGLTLINWLYGFFILPESLTAEHRRKFEWKRANPVGSLLSLKRFPIMDLITSLLLVYVSAHAVQSNWSYYTIAVCLRWSGPCWPEGVWIGAWPLRMPIEAFLTSPITLSVNKIKMRW